MPLTLPIENIIPSVEKGCLYIVATPIGNFNDITLRAAAILMGVDLIAAEDTRSTACLLSHYGIKTRLISCHEHNEIQRIPKLIDLLKENQTIALVSDAGTPTVSDPGYRLVSKAAAEGIKIVPVPGACAAVAALSVSGLPTDSYTFIGFPARKTAKLTRQLEALAKEPRTIIFYESPRRLLDLIDALIETMGDRQAVLTRELTKLYEEIVRGALSDIRSQLLKKKEIKGECTLLIQGAEKRPAISWDKISTEIQNLLMDSDIPIAELSKQISKKYGVTRKKVYNIALEVKNRCKSGI